MGTFTERMDSEPTFYWCERCERWHWYRYDGLSCSDEYGFSIDELDQRYTVWDEVELKSDGDLA